jgi:gamma-glutamyl-gamma-aminobutyrate hydrolase PuuD
MIIGIIPSIKEYHKKQLEFSIDLKLISFLKETFANPKIKILLNKETKNIDLLCISGGNDILKFSKTKKNILRHKLDKHFYDICKKRKIPILGICHGAQFIASEENSIITKKKHLGNHFIKFNKKKFNKKKYLVNSFHNYVIKKLSKDLNIIAYAGDTTVESFVHKKYKILGIMWHPERRKTASLTDIEIIKNFL